MNASTMHNTREPSREAVAEAAAWITRLHSARRSPEVEMAFRSWLIADEMHARAFEGMTEIWEGMPAMRQGELAAVGAPRVRSPSRVWARAAVIAGICVAIGLLAYGLLRDPSYYAGIGEQRIVNLDDGTRVSLNSGTRMTVEYSKVERRIELNTGEAFFEVAHNSRLPFVVMAGGNRVTAIGTSFAVRYEQDRTAVTLVEGRVAVASAKGARADIHKSQSADRLLNPGERWTMAANKTQQIDTPRIEAVTAWRHGEVIFDETLLSEAVVEMNRYDSTSIVIDDPAIAALPVSGIYRTGDSPGFAQIVAEMYGLSIAQHGGRIHLNGQPRPRH